jgi:hypothetical protein
MTTLDKRLDKLEAANDSGAPVFLWREMGETAQQALKRHAASGRVFDPERVVFVSWQETA